MGKTATRLLKNTIWVLWQRLGTRGIAFALTIILVRKLGPESYGILTYGLSIASLFVIFADLGLSTLVVRKMARDREEMQSYFGRVAVLKFIAIVIMFALLTAFLLIMTPGRALTVIMILLGVSVFAQNTASFYASIFQAWEKMHLSALIETAQKCALLVLCAAVLLAGHALPGVACSYALAGLLTLSLSVIVLHRAFPTPSYKVDFKFYGQIIRESLPFAAIALISTIYFRLDIVMLKYFQNEQVVGWYGVAYHLYYTLATAFGAFLVAVFPLMSRLAVQSDKSELEKVARIALKLVVSLGLPLSLGGLLLSKEILHVLFGAEYAPSAEAFRLFSLLIAVGFLNSFVCYFLTATNRAAITMKALAVTVVINAVLNYFLIPMFSLQGAVLATVVSELIFMSLLLFNSQNLIKPILSMASAKALLATAMMGVAILLAQRYGIHAALVFTIGVIIYPAVLLSLRFLTEEEKRLLRSFRRSFRNGSST